MTKFMCRYCGNIIDYDDLIEHIKDEHSEAYYDALDNVVREYFGPGAILDEED